MAPRRRSAALVVVLALLAGCGTAAPPSSSSGASGTYAERLRDAVSVEAITADLAHLEEIAKDHGGVRADGTGGYDASASFVAQALRDLGYRVSLDAFTLPLFSEVGTATLEVGGGAAFTAGTDFRAMLFSASGDVTGHVTPVGFDEHADPVAFAARGTGKGCEAADFAGVPKGAILLVQPGPCFRRATAQNAVAAKAAALIVSYPQWEPGFVLRPTLLSPDGITIPVIGATGEVGLALAAAAKRGATVHLRTSTAIVERPAANVVADSPGGDAKNVIMLGGHLDSVIDGPGINDNGSGTMTILEIARRLAAIGAPKLKVRFAFWAGEELGLWGAEHYVRGLGSDALGAIRVYLNFDMLGSPNGGRLVYADRGAASGSESVTRLFTSALAQAGLTSDTMDLGGASDHYIFQQAGIATGGLFSGANEIKSSVEAQRFGGTQDALMDACYHRSCDGPGNVDRRLLGEMARAAAYVTGELASGEVGIVP